MSVDLTIPTRDAALTVALITDVLLAVAYSAEIIAGALYRRGGEADLEAAQAAAVSRTAEYFKTERGAVNDVHRMCFTGIPYDLTQLATRGLADEDRHILGLGRVWLTMRGKPNLLTRPYLN